MFKLSVDYIYTYYYSHFESLLHPGYFLTNRIPSVHAGYHLGRWDISKSGGSAK
jgi:hypothetical protein